MTTTKVHRVTDLDWEEIAEGHEPRGRYVLVRGPSGYKSPPHSYAVALFDDEFRPHNPWVDPGGDAINDAGWTPKEYAEL